MKQCLAVILLCVSFMSVGCKTVTTTQPLAPVATGYANPDDQKMAGTLAAANGFYHTIQCETQGLGWSVPTQACTPDPRVKESMKLNSTETQAFSAFAVSLNVANALYRGFHNGQATQAEAQAATDKVQAQQTTLQNSIPQAVK